MKLDILVDVFTFTCSVLVFEMQQQSGIITCSVGVSKASCIYFCICNLSRARAIVTPTNRINIFIRFIWLGFVQSFPVKCLFISTTKSYVHEPTRSVVVQCCDVLFVEEVRIIILDEIFSSVDSDWQKKTQAG